MGFFNIKIWLAEKPENKIYKIQKVIDQLNEVWFSVSYVVDLTIVSFLTIIIFKSLL